MLGVVELTQTQLLTLMTPEADRLKAEVLDRQQFESAFKAAWDAATRLEGNDRAASMAFSRLAQLRLSRDKQTAAVLDADKGTPARDLTALNLVELQVLTYYTALAAGETLNMTGADWRAVAVVDMLRRCEKTGT